MRRTPFPSIDRGHCSAARIAFSVAARLRAGRKGGRIWVLPGGSPMRVARPQKLGSQRHAKLVNL